MSLRRVFCDRTNITDECVTALLTASALTLERLSLADCRHLRDLHGAWERAEDESPESPRRFGRLRELDISGSSWSPRGLIALLRGAHDSLTALNLASTHVSRGSVGQGDDFGEVASAVLGCARLRRLRISRNAKVTAEALGRLAAGGALESLSAVRCARAGEEALRRRLGTFAGTCRIDVVGDDFAWTTSRG